MDTDIKRRWVDALRSGKYKQGWQYLAPVDSTSGNVTYCCLGILCELAVEDGIATRVFNEEAQRYDYDTPSTREPEGHILPPTVVRWAGLNSTNPNVVGHGGVRNCLGEINDSGADFLTIADIIEENL